MMSHFVTLTFTCAMSTANLSTSLPQNRGHLGLRRPNSLQIREHMSNNMTSMPMQNFSLLLNNSPDVDKIINDLCNGTASPLTPTSFLNPKFVTQDEDNFANFLTKKMNELKQESESSEVQHITDISYSGSAYEHTKHSSQVSSDLIGSNQQVIPHYVPCTSLSAQSQSSSSLPRDVISNEQLAQCSMSIPPLYPAQSSSPSSSMTDSCDSRSWSNSSRCTDTGKSNNENFGKGLHYVKDKIDRKRARNREAARKCREKKLSTIKSLEAQKLSLINANKLLESKLQKSMIETEKLNSFVVQYIGQTSLKT